MATVLGQKLSRLQNLLATDQWNMTVKDTNWQQNHQLFKSKSMVPHGARRHKRLRRAPNLLAHLGMVVKKTTHCRRKPTGPSRQSQRCVTSPHCLSHHRQWHRIVSLLLPFSCPAHRWNLTASPTSQLLKLSPCPGECSILHWPPAECLNDIGAQVTPPKNELNDDNWIEFYHSHFIFPSLVWQKPKQHSVLITSSRAPWVNLSWASACLSSDHGSFSNWHTQKQVMSPKTKHVRTKSECPTCQIAITVIQF